MTNNNQMTYTIAEHIEMTHSYWYRLMVEVCPICTNAFPTIADTDPGSVVEAIGALEVCQDCQGEYGGYVFSEDYRGINFYDKFPECRDYERLVEELEKMEEEFNATPLWEISESFVASLADMKQTVEEFRQDIVQLLKDGGQSGYYPGDGMGYDEEEEEYTDLETEKWNNYWNDFNQCGIRVSY